MWGVIYILLVHGAVRRRPWIRMLYEKRLGKPSTLVRSRKVSASAYLDHWKSDHDCFGHWRGSPSSSSCSFSSIWSNGEFEILRWGNYEQVKWDCKTAVPFYNRVRNRGDRLFFSRTRSYVKKRPLPVFRTLYFKILYWNRFTAYHFSITNLERI